MRTLKILLLVIFIGFQSCEKKNDVITFDLNTMKDKLEFKKVEIDINAKPENYHIIHWDEWGLSKFNCDFWGLCNFSWVVVTELKTVNNINDYNYVSLLEYDDNIGYYFDILLSEPVPADIPEEYLNLPVDDAIIIDSEEGLGKDLICNENVYEFIPSLDEFGGFRVYLDEL